MFAASAGQPAHEVPLMGCGTGCDMCVQARLEVQQKRLQKRLKLALQINQLPPCTSVDTMTVADKIVSALDKLAEVRDSERQTAASCEAWNFIVSSFDHPSMST